MITNSAFFFFLILEQHLSYLFFLFLEGKKTIDILEGRLLNDVQ